MTSCLCIKGFIILNQFQKEKFYEKFERCRNKFGMTLAALALSAALCFTACQTGIPSSEPTYYTVTVSSSIEHGKVTADKSSAEAGATVKLTATADSGYELKSYSVKDASANTITVTDGTFTMPKSNVTVSATFKETVATPQKTAMYTVSISSSIEHGKVTADKSSAEAGATVKLTATADSGYELESYSVKDASANAITVTEGTFTMPKSNVTVSATFKAIAVTPQKSAGSISYATTSVEKKTVDEAFTNPLTKAGDGTVTYASSKTDVATVNASTGEVTIVGAGTATITATVADSDTYTYATKTTSYTLTVTQSVTIPEGFVKILGTTIKGNETWTPSSKVFVSGRRLTIPDLYVCDHEVTRGEFKALMGTDPSTADAYDKSGKKLKGDDVLKNPVNSVNWYAAIAYCNKLSVKGGLDCAYTVSGISDWENLAYSSIPTSKNDLWNAATCNFEATAFRRKQNGNGLPVAEKTTLMQEATL
ncbi:MAG: SUMF1/EgtB/PvdO family nonheme iron enzyme [Treponema sp.]|nr:SUMF1/EgtB/PvdO family nonheme iron enzyme [Treponema sp.]